MAQAHASRGDPLFSRGEVMASSKEKTPAPAVVLPVGDGRVEVTVIDGAIWLSDYASGKSRNFTLVIPRKRLQGHKSARQGVFDCHCEDAKREPSLPMAAARTSLLKQAPPRKAGYWYELPSPAHGGPVVIVEE